MTTLLAVNDLAIHPLKAFLHRLRNRLSWWANRSARYGTRCWNLSLVLTVIWPIGCGRKPAPVSKPTPAKVAHIAQEEQLNNITLTPEAEQRLGITTAIVALNKVDQWRTYGGEIALPTGASIVVSAPVGGTLQAPDNALPAVGATVRARQPIFLLLPLLSAEREVLTPAERIRFAEARNAVAQSQIDAAGQVQQAQVQVDAAQIGLERAERLLREQVGTVRAVDDAKAQLNLAQKTFGAATSRKNFVDGIKFDEDPGKLAPLNIESPRAGILRAEHAAPGELVAAGAPLFEVMDFSKVWVRVAVYAGEVEDLSLDQPALVSGLADLVGEAPLPAAPVAAPPTSVPLAAAVDLYYELPNPAGKFKPGQRVTARLMVRGRQESLTIPWSAVMHDIHGGEWVYEQTSPQQFVRRRVEVRYVNGSTAVLARGPAAGTSIVTSGVVELYGTEFGFAK